MSCPAEEPSEANDHLAAHVALVRHSLKQWTGCGLIEEEADPVIAARRLYYAPFALLSHGTEDDPLINYANHAAQKAFGMAWHEIVGMPSRLSAEAEDDVQTDRNALLKRVAEHGFIDDYSGVRIAKGGKRFHIQHATVWNLLDEDGRYAGQAAMFSIQP